MSKKNQKLKKIAILFVVLGGLAVAYDAITHADFYQDLERLNLDNHQH
ncbi:MAG: hypothetical protein GWP34_08440 [Alphaproteobacteria bacterium]|nr:hypothetical protein [Alphaproteobacteria bacterium]